MAYQFLTATDIEGGIQDKLFTANTPGMDNTVMETIEKQKIAFIRAKLSSRYDMDAVFEETGDDRNGVIVEILLRLCLYDFIRRNAARKVPEDYKEYWQWALKELEKIQGGELYPGLPPVVDENGDGNTIWGNNTNPDNYI